MLLASLVWERHLIIKFSPGQPSFKLGHPPSLTCASLSSLYVWVPLTSHMWVCPFITCQRVPIYFACASKSLGTSPLGGIPKKGPSLFTEEYRRRAIILGSLHHNSPSSISCRQYEEHVMTLHPSVQKAYLQLHWSLWLQETCWTLGNSSCIDT